MKKFLLLALILFLIAVYCINGEFNSFAPAEYRDIFARCSRVFRLNGDAARKTDAVYSFAGGKEDISLLAEKFEISIIDTQTLQGRIIYYGYSPRFGRCVDYRGSRCNVQMVYCSGTITVGMPVLTGSY
ncbi:MAG: hypothetical protein ACOYIQ_04400 [Christensenellales bacterium]|jgi:hypothetical protein